MIARRVKKGEVGGGREAEGVRDGRGAGSLSPSRRTRTRRFSLAVRLPAPDHALSVERVSLPVPHLPPPVRDVDRDFLPRPAEDRVADEQDVP